MLHVSFVAQIFNLIAVFRHILMQTFPYFQVYFLLRKQNNETNLWECWTDSSGHLVSIADIYFIFIFLTVQSFFFMKINQKIPKYMFK